MYLTYPARAIVTIIWDIAFRPVNYTEDLHVEEEVASIYTAEIDMSADAQPHLGLGLYHVVCA